LDDEFHAQIHDFGLSRHSDDTVTGSGVLHLNFAAPELLGCTDANTDKLEEHSTARTQVSDVYSFGCLYYEVSYIKYYEVLAKLLARITQIHYDATPFGGLGPLPIIEAVTRGERPPRLDNPPLSDDAWNLVNQCWAQNKRLRPGIRDVVKIMKSWKKPSVLSSPSISRSSDRSDSISRGRALGHVVAPSTISDSTGAGGFSNRSSDDFPETPNKAEKSIPYNYFANAFRTVRTNKKRGRQA
jgi:hypothetical protein